MISRRSSRRWPVFACAAAVSAAATTAARADVGPPVEIKMPPGTKQAVAGQEYAGAFEVRIYRPGTLADFRIEGESWTILEFEAPAGIVNADIGTLVIPFRAVPSDADKPIGLTLTYNGRRAAQRYEIGPRYFTSARRGYQSEPSAQASSVVEPGRGGACPSDQVRCVGRIVYTRPDGKIVGADRIHVELRDIDPVGHEVMWSGTTDVRGFFDTGCADADIDGDGSGPDLVLYYETQTDWVDVTDNSIGELTYWWETGEIVDFAGNFHDFGSTTPAATSTHAALHIFNTVTRIRRFVEEVGGHTPGKVQVEWPVDEWTHYQHGPEEIHVQAPHQWNEDVIVHEYGHHFIHNYHTPPSTNYCNGLCDDNPPEDCGHCGWCPENATDAFNEGWPNWLADIMKRSMIQDDRYTFDDGEAYVPFDYFAPNAFEWVSTCGIEPVGDFGDPVMTEGFVAALLRDIEDGTQDDQDGDGIGDALCLGAGPNLAVLVNDTPTTVIEFINAFISRYPDEIDGLWPTAFNLGGAAYTSSFPADTQPPGLVTVLDSPSHPLGVGGGLPCITFEWEPAPDDVTGATAYSYFLHQDPAGIEPDEGADPVALTDHCRLRARAPAGMLGNWYLSIKARDSLGNWSSQLSTFGPFEVLDCNGSGLLDICDIDCLHTGVPGGGICEFAISPCGGAPGCGTSSDCNENLQPDECDIASGISEDCNNDGIPDECQPMKNYTGLANTPPQSPPADGTDWGDPRNWRNLDAPADGDMACVRSGLPIPVVYFTEDSLRLESLSCEEDFGILRLESWFPDLELDGPSFIQGALTISGVSTLKVDDTLDVAGALNWSGGIIQGPGNLNVSGGLDLNPSSRTELRTGAHLSILGGAVDTHNGKYIELYDTSRFTIGPPVTYTYHGNFLIFAGSATTAVNVVGELVRASGTGRATLGSRVLNDGLIHNQVGELYMGAGGTHSGNVLSDPGTLLTLANGIYEWLAGSSLVADDVTLSGGNASTVRGHVDIAGTLTVGSPSAANVTFTNEADVTGYGETLFARAGIVRFESPAAPAVDFDHATVGVGTVYCGNPYFDTGETFVMNTFQLVCGTINGADPILINESFTWGGGGSFMPGGAVTCLGPVTIQSTSSQRNLSRVFDSAAHATFLGQFAPSGAGRFNNLATGTVHLQGDNTGLAGGQSTNAGTITKTAGSGRSILAGMTNTGLIRAQTGEIYFYFSGVNHGAILGDPGTLLTFNGTHEAMPGSSLTADNVKFSGSASILRGDVDISGTLTIDGGTCTFTSEANVVRYGSVVDALTGFLYFQSPVPEPTVEFDAVKVGGGSYPGGVYFNTGQPVGIGTLNIVNGNIDGADPITIRDSFTWGGVGSFFPGGMVTCNAPWTLQASSSQRDMHRDFLNNGYAALFGALNLGSGADFINQPSGVVDFKANAGGFGLSSASTLYNNGTLIKSGGTGTSAIRVHFRNAGSVEIQTGVLELYGGYGLTYIQTAGQTMLNGGDINLTLGAVYQLLGGDLLGVGTVTGPVNNTAGAVMPGLSAGVLTVDGNYTQAAAATLAIEIGGLTQGADYDLLDITGTAALAGTLEVTLIDGFMPNNGHTFEILTGGTITGDFDQVILANSPGNLELSVTYSADSVTLTMIGPVPGDCDEDGDADLDDFLGLEACLAGPQGGLGTGCACFDLDGSGAVDLLDFAAFQTVFGG